MSASRSPLPGLSVPSTPPRQELFSSSPPPPFVRKTAVNGLKNVPKIITAKDIDFLVEVLFNKRHTGYYGHYYQELYDALANKIIWYYGKELGVLGFRGARHVIEKLGGGVTSMYNSDNIITSRIRDDLKDSGITLEIFKREYV